MGRFLGWRRKLPSFQNIPASRRGPASIHDLGSFLDLLVVCVYQALAEALKQNNSLTTLDWKNHNIGDEGGKARVGVWGA